MRKHFLPVSVFQTNLLVFADELPNVGVFPPEEDVDPWETQGCGRRGALRN